MILLIANLSDDNDLAVEGVKEKESVPIKLVKKEKVSTLMTVIIIVVVFVVYTKM